MKITVNNTKMNYEISGKEDAAVIMFSHSLGANLDMWEPQLAAVESHFRVLRYDTRGHGQSDAPEGQYTLELLADDVIDLLTELKIDKIHWVGISMGGMIGQCLALRYPEKLLSLSLCDTAAVMPPETQPIWQERIDTARDKGMSALVQSTMERWFTPDFIAQDPPAVGRIREQFETTPVNGFIGCSEAIRRLDYVDQLSRISHPTLIMVGEDDPGTPVAASREIHDRITGSKMIIIPKAAHLSNIEQAEFFNDHLIDFLALRNTG